MTQSKVASGRRAIVISISSDIGLALATRFLDDGWQVSGTYRSHVPALDQLPPRGAQLIDCDLTDKDSIDRASTTLAASGAWDVLIVAPGVLAPIGFFTETSIDDWEESIAVNFSRQLRCVHRLLPSRKHDAPNGPCVIFFAGGGTNSAVTRFSAYTVSKIALIKMCELLDAEILDTRFATVGPGWVKTKIHLQTLAAKANAGQSYRRTEQMFADGDWVPIDQVVDCCMWLIGASREIIGGRNFSVASDAWGSAALEAQLARDADMYKLRRAGNTWKTGPEGIQRDEAS